jgi:pyruvate carboxylase subunit B
VRYFVRIHGEEHEVTLDGSTVHADGAEREAHVVELEGTPVRVVTIGDRAYTVLVRRERETGRYALDIGGFTVRAQVLDERTRAIRQLAGATARAAGPAALVAPMPGLVVRVHVRPGDRVQAGQGVLVIEAMKMENELKAPSPGVVRAVQVSPGSAVEKGAVLLEIDATA